VSVFVPPVTLQARGFYAQFVNRMRAAYVPGEQAQPLSPEGVVYSMQQSALVHAGTSPFICTNKSHKKPWLHSPGGPRRIKPTVVGTCSVGAA